MYKFEYEYVSVLKYKLFLIFKKKLDIFLKCEWCCDIEVG